LKNTKTGLIFGLSAYILWGLFPLYWPLLEPAGAFEIVGNRAVWSLVLDWTTKIDFNLNQSLYPTSALINGTLDFQFKLDQDYANQDFNSQTNRIEYLEQISLS
jgi:hypothetical protein